MKSNHKPVLMFTFTLSFAKLPKKFQSVKSVKFKTMVDSCVSKSSKIFLRYSVSKNQSICSLPYYTVPTIIVLNWGNWTSASLTNTNFIVANVDCELRCYNKI